MTSEKNTQQAVIKSLKNFYHVKIITAGTAGHPDIIACIWGRFVAIEIKSSTGKQSPLQKYRQEEIEKNGGVYLLINSIKDFEGFLKEFNIEQNENF